MISRFRRLRQADGMTLTEVLVTVGIIGVVAAVAIPVFLSQQTNANATVAVHEGASLAVQVGNILEPYPSLAPTGQSWSNSIRVQDGMLAVRTPDGAVSQAVNTTAGATVASSGIGANSWCFTVTYNGQGAVYTNDGYQSKATYCNPDGTPNTDGGPIPTDTPVIPESLVPSSPFNVLASLPTAVTATASNGANPFNRAFIMWTSSDSGNSPISGYRVTSTPGGLTCTSTTASCFMPGLAAGTAYTFAVEAQSADGYSAPSSPSNTVTTGNVPGAPATATVSLPSSSAATGTGGANPYNTATISWTAPTSDGNLPISGYTVTSAPGGLTCTTPASGTSCVIAGLGAGVTYTFDVTATNVAGAGAARTTGPATIASIPAAPTSVIASLPSAAVATALGGANPYDKATISWTAPASNNGANITGYTVTSTPGNLTCTTASTTCTIAGLTVNTSYTFTVRAANVVGSSGAGTSNSVQVAAVPGAPAIQTAIPAAAAGTSTTSTALTWTAPAANRSNIADYTVYYKLSNAGTWSTFAHTASTATAITVTGLTQGADYNFAIAAKNAVGEGSQGSANTTATNIITPSAPAVSNDGWGTVSWNVGTTACPVGTTQQWLIQRTNADGGAVSPATTVTGWRSDAASVGLSYTQGYPQGVSGSTRCVGPTGIVTPVSGATANNWTANLTAPGYVPSHSWGFSCNGYSRCESWGTVSCPAGSTAYYRMDVWGGNWSSAWDHLWGVGYGTNFTWYGRGFYDNGQGSIIWSYLRASCNTPYVTAWGPESLTQY